MGWRDLLAGVRRRLRPTPGRVQPPPHQLASVAAVIEALRAVDGTLEPGDGIRHFNRMYLRVTELVAARIEDGTFGDREFITRLDIVFAHLYLDAVRGSGQDVPRCWAPLFESRDAPLVPVQFAIAGMNAHINHDLPVAVVQTCRQLGKDPGDPGVRADYDLVTKVLAEGHEEVRQSFLSGIALDVDRELAPVLTLVGSWSIGRARDAAWVNTEVLWQLQHLPELDAEFRDTLSRSVGLAGRALLTLVPEPV
ncbi:hypothetical protein FB467_2655 [Ornithinicoccus hortensis]|uniref:Uncharacterized protein n=1 Tax=Ornithinicoccus hortensis TaxID=82346 RepID=A0A542YTV5_9MICO|nr:hypothetical protein FB467_2655 [Ornithinicoccus hortensis]